MYCELQWPHVHGSIQTLWVLARWWDDALIVSVHSVYKLNLPNRPNIPSAQTLSLPELALGIPSPSPSTTNRHVCDADVPFLHKSLPPNLRSTLDKSNVS